MSRASLLAAGTFVVDYHKLIKHYPNERASARVIKEEMSPGGAPFNLLMNLAKLGVDVDLHACGRIGRDLDGQYIIDSCKSNGISVEQINADNGVGTGYTDVYTVEQSGKHTCFHFDGACLNFNRRDVKLRAVKNLEYLFLGSLGALGKLGQPDSETGRIQASQLLLDAHKRGIQTILEFAPLDHGTELSRYEPTLAAADYVIINDRTAETILQTSLYSESQFDPGLARLAAEKFLEVGLRKAVIIQSGAGAVYVGADGAFHHGKGYFLPWEQRVGSAGVDHAFCAGFIEGMLAGKPVDISLDQGLAVSTVCRKELTPSGAIGSLQSCMDFCKTLERVAA